MWLAGLRHARRRGRPSPRRCRVSAFVPRPRARSTAGRPTPRASLVASPFRPDSSRAGRAALRFDPDGPLPPPPSISVHPVDRPGRGGDRHGRPARGFGGLDQSSVDLSVCRTGTNRCDETVGAWLEPAADGSFSTEVTWPRRSAPGTATRGRLPHRARVRGGRPRRVRRAQRRPPRSPSAIPRRWTTATGCRCSTTSRSRTTSCTAAPPMHRAPRSTCGSTCTSPPATRSEERPVVVWLAGGWFRPGNVREMQSYAEAFARRGYVSVTMELPGPARAGLLPDRRHRGRDRGGVRRHRRRGRGRALAARPRRRVRHRPRRHRRRRACRAGRRPPSGWPTWSTRRSPPPCPWTASGSAVPTRGDPPFLAVHEQRSNVAPAAPVPVGVRPGPVEGHDVQHGRAADLVRRLRPRPAAVDRGRVRRLRRRRGPGPARLRRAVGS